MLRQKVHVHVHMCRGSYRFFLCFEEGGHEGAMFMYWRINKYKIYIHIIIVQNLYAYIVQCMGKNVHLQYTWLRQMYLV